MSQCVTTFFQPAELIRHRKATKLRDIPDKSIWKLTITAEFQKTCFELPCGEKRIGKFRKPKYPHRDGFEAVTTFPFVFEELKPQTAKRKVHGGFSTLQEIDHYARISNHSIFCGNFTGFEAPMERRNKKKSISSCLIGKYIRVCATNRSIFVQKWFLIAILRSRKPKYPPVMEDSVHFKLLWESSRSWNDTFYQEITLLSVYRSAESQTSDFELQWSWDSIF